MQVVSKLSGVKSSGLDNIFNKQVVKKVKSIHMGDTYPFSQEYKRLLLASASAIPSATKKKLLLFIWLFIHAYLHQGWVLLGGGDKALSCCCHWNVHGFIYSFWWGGCLWLSVLECVEQCALVTWCVDDCALCMFCLLPVTYLCECLADWCLLQIKWPYKGHSVKSLMMMIFWLKPQPGGNCRQCS